MLLPHPATAMAKRDDGRRRIAVDDVTAALLDTRFEVRKREEGLSLAGEREIADGARTLLGKPTTCGGREWEERGQDR